MKGAVINVCTLIIDESSVLIAMDDISPGKNWNDC